MELLPLAVRLGLCDGVNEATPSVDAVVMYVSVARTELHATENSRAARVVSVFGAAAEPPLVNVVN